MHYNASGMPLVCCWPCALQRQTQARTSSKNHFGSRARCHTRRIVMSLAATSGNLNYLAHCISGRGNSVPRCCVGQDKLCLSSSVSFRCLVLAVKAWCGGAVTFLFVVFQSPRLQRRSCTSITQPTRIIYQSQSEIN